MTLRPRRAGDSSAPEGVQVIPLSPLRKTIARRLTEAKQSIPHFYLTAEYELDGLLTHRAKLNEEDGVKVSVNDLIVWCVAQALIREPRVNVNLVGDDIHQFSAANVSVAIATDNGLYSATLYAADTKSPAEISAATAELADKAQSGKLTKDGYLGRLIHCLESRDVWHHAIHGDRESAHGRDLWPG